MVNARLFSYLILFMLLIVAFQITAQQNNQSSNGSIIDPTDSSSDSAFNADIQSTINTCLQKNNNNGDLCYGQAAENYASAMSAKIWSDYQTKENSLISQYVSQVGTSAPGPSLISPSPSNKDTTIIVPSLPPGAPGSSVPVPSIPAQPGQAPGTVSPPYPRPAPASPPQTPHPLEEPKTPGEIQYF